MTHRPNNMSDDFAAHAEKITKLLADNYDFSKLFEQYEAINTEIYESEQEIKPIDDHALEILKKKRLVMKDQIMAALAAQE